MILNQLHEIHIFKDRFRNLFSHIPSIIFSRSGSVQQMNDAAEAALGITRKELIGKSFFKAVCRVINESGKKITSQHLPWNQAFTQKRVITNVVTGIILPNGKCCWQQSTSMPLVKDSETNNSSTITIFSDITKHKQSQVQFMQHQKMEAIGSLASGLAHDFNNILTSILSAAQLLLIDLKGSPFQDCEPLKDIEAVALRGAELAKQLLLLSRPSAPKGKTRLNERINDLKKIFRRTLPKNISLELNLNHHELLVHIVPTQLEQVMLNLIINARDAMPAGGTIKMHTSLVTFSAIEPPPLDNVKRGTYARIDLSDTGIGIAPEVLPRIFEPFYTSKEHQGGTGLGLSLVFAIIKANKGYITAESMLAKGTKISIYLPAKPCKAKQNEEKTKDTLAVNGTETVLVVDDEQIITKSTARLLQRYGYQTMTAYNGKEALDIISKHKGSLDLVLLDMEMPEMDGLTCLMKLSELKPDLKVITLSGHISKPQMWDMIYAKSKVFVQKPFDINHLLQVIRDTLDNKAQIENGSTTLTNITLQ